MTFELLGLAPALVRTVHAQGYTTPTPIQQQAIPHVLAGRDVLAAAQTGTGKTAAFTLPLLHTLQAAGPVPKGPRAPQILVLVPTRELAAQVEESMRLHGADALGFRSVLIFGGVNIRPQIETLRRGVDVIVATPGRLLDHAQQRTVDLSQVRYLVLDEADRMLDMGFIHDIRKLLAKLPAKRQNLLFSATFSQQIRRLAEGLLHDPVVIDIAPRNSATEAVTQRAVFVNKAHKAELLAYLIGHHNWQQVLVFTRTKHGANRLTERLVKSGINAVALHGNKSQNARLKALAAFKAGEARALVATDIAARGLDIDLLPYVVNYELPSVPEDYVHRIGRTGRAGRVGEAISLVGADEADELRGIERLLRCSIPVFEVAGFEPSAQPERAADDDARPPRQPRQQRSSRAQPRSEGGRHQPSHRHAPKVASGAAQRTPRSGAHQPASPAGQDAGAQRPSRQRRAHGSSRRSS